MWRAWAGVGLGGDWQSKGSVFGWFPPCWVTVTPVLSKGFSLDFPVSFLCPLRPRYGNGFRGTFY